MQPVSTEYSGQPRRPTRRFRSRTTRPRSAGPPLLCALLLAACGDGRDASTPATAPAGGIAPFDDVSIDPAESIDAELTISIEPRDDALFVHHTAARAALARAGADARLHLALSGVADAPERALVTAVPTPPAERGSARLDVAAHRLPWNGTRLTARLEDATGRTISTASAPLAPALAATASVRVPAITTAGERVGEALAFSPDGRTIGLSRPGDGAVLLYPSRPDALGGVGTVDDPARVAVDGLVRAEPGTIRLTLATLASTVAVSWHAGGLDHLSIHEAQGEGWIAVHRATFEGRNESPREPARERRADRALRIASDGRRIDLTFDDGRIRRLVRTDGGWSSSLLEAPDDALGQAHVRPDGAPVRLRRASDVWWLDLGEDREPERLPLDADVGHDLLPVSVRIAIDAGTRTLAVASLHGPIDADRALRTLRLWTRDAPTAPWRPAATFAMGPTASDAPMTLAFGGRNGVAADTLLWTWRAPTASGRSAATDGRIATRADAEASGLLVLTDAEPVAAFGRAARTDLPTPRWRAAFALPRDGGAFGATSPADVATLSEDGSLLAIGWPPDRPPAPWTPGNRSTDRAMDGVAIARPAGVVRLLD